VPALRSPFPNVVQLLPICEHCTSRDVLDIEELARSFQAQQIAERNDG
jgi:hypothetical protein